MKSTKTCPLLSCLLLLPTSALLLPTTDAFSPPASPLLNPYNEKRHRRPILHRHPSTNDSGKESTSLFEKTFKMKLPWETQSTLPRQQSSSKTKQTNRREQVNEPSNQSPNVSKSKRRIPRQHRQSYDLYGPPPIPNEEEEGQDLDDYVGSPKMATVTAQGSVSKQSSTPHSKRINSSKGKLGILLIDHGSKRQASNDALYSIATAYEMALNSQRNAHSSTEQEEEPHPTVAVRASHMELASPTIESGLRSLLVREGVTNIVCVPYFLGGGRHVTTDVPNLIDDAKLVLEQEGLMDLSQGERVDIVTSRYLGSDVESMLEVVNDLVGEALKDNGWDETVLWRSLKSHDVSGGDNRVGHRMIPDDKEADMKNDSLQIELHKYTNRASLLENLLEKKVQQLRTMTNRVAILEDILNKKLEENDIFSRRKSENVGGNGKRPNEERGAGDKLLANLTSTIDSLVREKEATANQTQILKAQAIDKANEYNKTVTELLDKISQLEGELESQNKSIAMLLCEQGQQQNQTLEKQQQTINELQAQLADILDAYNELEQVQNETETSVISYRNQLSDVQRENEQLHQKTRAKEEEFHLKLRKSESMLEEEMIKFQNMLEASKDEYERLLAREKTAAKEWKDKWNELSAKENQRTKDSVSLDSRSEDEWSNMKNQLEEALHALNDSRNNIQMLETALKQQRDNQESYETSQQQQLEQQQQLQEYLQAQLQTYYETIKDQTEEISGLQKQIDEMQRKYDDSMLIATKSVEASQRRENDLLNNVEELESELKILQKEKLDYEAILKGLQERLKAAEMDHNLALAKEELDEQNKQLTMEVDILRRELDAVTGEKNTIIMEKVRLERVFIDRVLGEDRKPDGILVNTKTNKKKWSSYLWRPWTLLKRL